MGDLYVLQGNGEVGMVVFESGNIVIMQFFFYKNWLIKCVEVEIVLYYIVMGMDRDFDVVVYVVIVYIVEFFQERKGFDFFDLLILSSIVIDFEVI